MIFETERLIIRQLSESDLDSFHEMQCNPRVMKYTSRPAMTLEENIAEMQRVITAYKTEGNTFWVWAITRKEDAGFVGTCALIVNEDGEQEIGFRMRELFWGHGYGKEVAGGLIRYAFEELRVPKLVGYVYSPNVASVKILHHYMQLEKEFFNEAAQCLDRKYVLSALPVGSDRTE